METKNKEYLRKGLMVLLISGLLVASITAISAWQGYYVLNDNTKVESGHLTGSTSYTVVMDVDGALGLPAGQIMRTRVREDKPFWPDGDDITSWDTSSDYSQDVSGLDSSKTYYVVWDMIGSGAVSYGWLKFY